MGLSEAYANWATGSKKSKKKKDNATLNIVIVLIITAFVVFWSVSSGGITLLAMFIGIIIGAWMASNSRDRGAKEGTQAGLFLAGLLLNIIALVLYFIFRPKKFVEEK